MNSQALPLPIPLYRPWWRRLADVLIPRPDAFGACRCFVESDYASLAELNPQTLRDIGAPEWIGERRETLRRVELELMRL